MRTVKKELEEVDVYFDPKPLSIEEQKRISDFIKSDKAKAQKIKLEEVK